MQHPISRQQTARKNPMETHKHPTHHSKPEHADHGHPGHDGHAGHDKHAGHDPEVFRRLFWWNLVLAAPVLVFSAQIQDWFGYSIDASWGAWVAPVIGTAIYTLGRTPIPRWRTR